MQLIHPFPASRHPHALRYGPARNQKPSGDFCTAPRAFPASHALRPDRRGSVLATLPTDTAPWPEEADGNGYTLALTDPTCDNHLPECWSASAQMNGTPGAANFPGVTATERETPETPLRIDIYPNPSAGQATVSVSGVTDDAVRIDVFDVRGRQVPVPASRISLPGKAVLNMGELAAGLYFVRIASSHGTVHRAVMVGW